MPSFLTPSLPLVLLQVLQERDRQLLSEPDVKAALLSILTRVVYFPLIFDKAAIQDACVELAGHWGGGCSLATTTASSQEPQLDACLHSDAAVRLSPRGYAADD